MDVSSINNKMDVVIQSLIKKFTTVQAGRANPSIFDGIMIDYYGVPTPLRQLANISVPEARQMLIKPFDKTCLSGIEKAIFEANLGLTPGNDGETIRIIIPAVTGERRIELSKQIKAMAEEKKISVRNIRHDLIEDLKKEELPEDVQKKNIEKIQEIVTLYNKKIDDVTREKEEDLMNL